MKIQILYKKIVTTKRLHLYIGIPHYRRRDIESRIKKAHKKRRKCYNPVSKRSDSEGRVA